MNKLTKTLCILMFAQPYVMCGQTSIGVKDVKQVITDWVGAKELAYNYLVKVEYPGNQKDQLKGEVYMNNSNKLLYNSCEAYTMIYTSRWFYRADHKNKQITLVDLDKRESREIKEGIEKDIFKNGALANFLDSVLIKHATIKSFKTTNDTVLAELSFPERMSVKKMSIAYNRKNKMLVRYGMSMFQPLRQKGSYTEGAYQNVTCSNFRKIGNRQKYELENFFTISNNHVVLKKYGKYKLNTNS